MELSEGGRKWVKKLFGGCGGRVLNWFGNKRVLAVNDLNLSLFPGHVTALLGHNGAGKSTTVSMLTGLIPPSKGTAIIDGTDIRHDLLKVRKVLGLCPQYNCLFDNLTVMEHFKLFRQLKGRDPVDGEAEKLLSLLGLKKKENCLSKTLSGGMKRKLSLAVALIGGSEVVILDEPSSGMDPGARHDAWTLIQSEKKKRTILLTTHHMEEADLLGDRIAILASGRLQCSGSSLYLKNRYGAGYHLSVAFTKPRDGVETPASWSDPDGFVGRTDTLLQAIRKTCPEANILSCVGQEATFSLPTERKDKFQNLFVELERVQSSLGVSSFGISATTMEDVFLKVGWMAEKSHLSSLSRENSEGGVDAELFGSSSRSSYGSTVEGGEGGEVPVALRILKGSRLELLEDETLKHPSGDVSVFHSGLTVPDVLSQESHFDNLSDSFNQWDMHFPSRNRGWRLFLQQFYAMLTKRVIHSVRNWKIALTQLLLPTVLLIAIVQIDNRLPVSDKQPPLLFNLKPFPDNKVVIFKHPFSSNRSKVLEEMYASVVNDDVSSVLHEPSNATAFMLERYKSEGSYTVDHKYIVGAQFDCQNYSRMCEGTGFFNNQPYHSVAISLNLINNAFLAAFETEGGGGGRRIETYNHPLPPTSLDNLYTWLLTGTKQFNIAFTLLFAMSFLSSTFCVFLVKEREGKSKHLQLLSGVHPLTFWLATFLWDFVNFLLPALLIFGLFFVFHLDLLTHGGESLLLLLFYGWAILPMMYVGSFFFKTPAGAFVKMTAFNILTGCILFLVVTILYVLNSRDVERAIEWAFIVLSPNFCLGQGLNVFYMNSFLREQCHKVSHICDTSPDTIPFCCNNEGYANSSLRWENPGIGREVFFMSLQGIVFWGVVVLLELNLFRSFSWRNCFLKLCSHLRNASTYEELDDSQVATTVSYMGEGVGGEDSDVAEEKRRVSQLEIGDKSSVLILNNLLKKYGDFRAVNGLSFAVKTGECFGLLGVNGAGKTSTFQMLTGENDVTAGGAFVAGINVKRNWRKAGKYVGYCPQFDALIEEMTASQTLFLFGRLRGIPESNLDTVVAAVLKAVGISKYSHSRTKTFSGGTKRRLSLGVALLGNPPLLLLDEPTTGVDPAARRAIWQILAKVRHLGTSIVLTSHSMEECEALCSRLGIMVGGKMQCLGTPQHIKQKHGSGYSLQMNIRKVQDVPYAIKTIGNVFPHSIHKETHHTQLFYELSRMEDMQWSKLFGTLEGLVEKIGIEDYCLSQTTLEAVFLGFSRRAVNQLETPETSQRAIQI